MSWCLCRDIVALGFPAIRALVRGGGGRRKETPLPLRKIEGTGTGGSEHGTCSGSVIIVE